MVAVEPDMSGVSEPEMVAVRDPAKEFPKPPIKLAVAEIRSIARAFANPQLFFGRTAQPRTTKKTKHAYLAPGMGAFGATMFPLRDSLRKAKVYTICWDAFRTNIGPTEWAIPKEVNAIRALAKKAGGPITYVGHSLGGLYGMFLIRTLQEEGLIDHAISIGSPVELDAEGANTSTNVGFGIKIMQALEPLYQSRIIDHWRPERELVPLIGVQRTSIIMIKDGIVNSLACELPEQPGCQNYYIHGGGAGNHIDALTNEVVAELVAHLTLNGNDPKDIPPELAAKLATREDIFKYKEGERVELEEPTELIELVNPTNPVDDLHTRPNGFEVAKQIVQGAFRPMGALLGRTNHHSNDQQSASR